MSDTGPPGEPPDGSEFPEPPPAEHGFAALPRWARIVIPTAGVVVLVLIGVIVWQATSGDEADATIEDVLEELADEEQTATTSIPPTITTAPASGATTVSGAEERVAPSTTDASATTAASTAPTSSSSTGTATTDAVTTTVSTTTTTSTTTTAPTRTTSTTAPTTTSTVTTTTRPATTTTRPPTTTTTLPPTTTTTTTVAPPTTTTTTLPPTTSTTTTTTTTTTLPPTTTEAPPTTPVPTTEAPPPTRPVPPGAIAPNARGFAESWNANAAGTGVPVLTESEISALENGPTATTFIAPLSDRVGLVGVVRNDDSSVAEVLLAWIPGGDETASNQLYRDAFDVLLRTINPDLTPDERAQLGADLGLAAQAPPFPSDETVTAKAVPNRYSRYVRDTSAATNTAIISVVDARPR